MEITYSNYGAIVVDVVVLLITITGVYLTLTLIWFESQGQTMIKLVDVVVLLITITGKKH
jgi:hypothetical protein